MNDLHRSRGSHGARVFLAALAILLGALPASGQDYFLHVNGDSINGDLKGLERGKLRFELAGSNTFSVDWVSVAGVGTETVHEVENVDGERFFGLVRPGQQEGTLDIVGDTDTVTLALVDIVGMTSLEASFWSRFDGLVEFGFRSPRPTAR